MSKLLWNLAYVTYSGLPVFCYDILPCGLIESLLKRTFRPGF